MRYRLILTLIACLAFPSMGSAQSSDSTTTVLAPGDAIRIQVWRNEELSGEFPIAADGSIVHPLYHQLSVAGVPMATVEQRVRAFLERFSTNVDFVIEPLVRVSVSGEVRTPNLFALRPSTSIAQAVALAGGVTQQGRADHVRLIRRGQVTLLDLTDPAGMAVNMPVQSGDQILVERKNASFFRDYVLPTVSVVSAFVTILNYLSNR